MHEQEARQQGLRLHYQLIDVERSADGAAALPRLIDAARTMDFAGLNITYPCKQAVIPLLDGLSDEATAMGAVNTVVFDDGRAIGHNTDGSGWAWGFRRTLPAADLSRVVLLGAGGAGSAIAHAVLRLGAQRLTLVDADAARSVALADDLNKRYAGARARGGLDAEAALADATGLIHATPTGMAKLPGLPLSGVVAAQRSVGVGDRVLPARDGTARRGAPCRLCGVRRRHDGGGAGGRSVPPVHGLEPDAERMRRHFLELISPAAA